MGAALLFPNLNLAQMPHDAIYMPKKNLCGAVMYSNNTWENYWEGTLRRDNQNIGKNITQVYSLMAAYGITNRLNLIVNIPYVRTHNTAGNLLGQRGWQDFSGFIKYKALDWQGLSLSAAVGASVPMSNYHPDFLPMSIGLKTKTATGRLIASYHHSTGLYVTGSAAYTYRSNIHLDKSSYFAYGKLYNTNEVELPNAMDAGLRLGYYKNNLQLEVALTHFRCTSGDDIRRGDMPFPTNNMRATNAGFYGKYQYRNVGVVAAASYVLAGLNVGQSLMLMGGITYQLDFGKKTK
jgi:predicted porin